MSTFTLVVYLVVMLSLLMACGAVVWIACNFHKLMQIAANAVIDVKSEGPTQVEQLVEYAAMCDMIKHNMVPLGKHYDAWQALPPQLRDAIDKKSVELHETMMLEGKL